jgi:hypothetical protein
MQKAILVFLGNIIFVVVGIIASIAGAGVLLTYGTEWSSHRKHARELDRAFNETLVPAASFIRSFAESEHRLPSDEELEAAGWRIAHGTDGKGMTVYRAPLNRTDEWGILGRDFLLETEVPDWNLYYRSWDKKRIEGNWE